MEKEIVEMIKELGTKLNDIGLQSFKYLVDYEFVSSLVVIIITAIFCAIALYIGLRFLSISKKIQSLSDTVLKGDASESWWFSEINDKLEDIHFACWAGLILLLICSVVLICVLIARVPDLFYPQALVIKDLLGSCGPL